MPIERQADEVRKVKKFEAGMVVNPVTIHPDATLADALQLHGRAPHPPAFPWSSAAPPSWSAIVTNRDVRFATNPKQADRRADDAGAPGHGGARPSTAMRRSGSCISTASRS